MTVRRMRLAAVLALTVLAGCTSAPAQEAEPHRPRLPLRGDVVPRTAATDERRADHAGRGRAAGHARGHRHRTTSTPRPAAGMLSAVSGLGPADGLRAAQQKRGRVGDRPGHPPRGRQVPGRVGGAARRPVLGHEVAVRHRRRGRHDHADRPEDRPAGCPDPGRTTRTTCTSRPAAAAAVSVAERLRQLVFYDPHTWAEQGQVVDPAVRRHRSRRLHPRWADGGVQLRVRRPGRRGRRPPPLGRADHRHADPEHAHGTAGREARPPRAAGSSSPTPTRVACGCWTVRRPNVIGQIPHRPGCARPLPEPGRQSSCTSPIGGKATASRCSTPEPASPSRPPGPSRGRRAPTWAGSPPMAASCGCPAGTTPRSTCSRPPTGT